MTPHRKKCPHVMHFNVPRDCFEINLQHQKRYSEDGKKFRGCRGLLGRVMTHFSRITQKIENQFLEDRKILDSQITEKTNPHSHFMQSKNAHSCITKKV